MTGLLVSVRSAEEAEAALAGGATLIDVKEPSRGSLGRPEGSTIAEVVQRVAGRAPVSAAFGELAGGLDHALPPGLAFVKWGLAGLGRGRDWRASLRTAGRLCQTSPGRGLVAVAYADWRRASAPPPEEVCEFAVEHRVAAFLVDTCEKDGTTLLDWFRPKALEVLVARCRKSSVPVALAGSLRLAQLVELLPLNPAWFAVRGAACRGGRRSDAIDPAAVRRLVTVLRTQVVTGV